MRSLPLVLVVMCSLLGDVDVRNAELVLQVLAELAHRDAKHVGFGVGGYVSLCRCVSMGGPGVWDDLHGLDVHAAIHVVVHGSERMRRA
jgi:hypothetical protein